VGRHSRSHPVFHPPIESDQWNAMDAWYDGMRKLYVPVKKKKGKSWQRALAINLNNHNHK